MGGFLRQYESDLAILERKCVDCPMKKETGCRYHHCNVHRKMVDLKENIAYCKNELSDYEHENVIAKRRRRYENTKALCETNIRCGIGNPVSVRHKGYISAVKL